MSTAGEKPIGIFDSGLGGLTVVRELTRLLPHENIVYFGDTGRVPYGTRSPETIARYAAEDAAFLLSKDVKMIIAACGTVSSVVSDLPRRLPVPCLGVVEPAAAAAAALSRTGKIGVTGTTATVRSRSYPEAVRRLRPNAEVFSQDCPLFVPLVEAGWIEPDDPVTLGAARRYLEAMRAFGPDTLILGCTHFPLIAPTVRRVMGEDVALVDAGLETAKAARRLLEERGLLSASFAPGRIECFVSDKPGDFERIASLFLGKPVSARVTAPDSEISTLVRKEMRS